MRKVLLLAVPVLAALIALFIPWREGAVFIHSETGDLAAYHPLSSDTLKIKYTHSIHLSDVIETYQVTDDRKLMMTELEYEDFAIGMPANAGEGETFVEENGKYFIRDMERVIPGFTMLVGDVDLELSLIEGEAVYDLKSVLQRGESYHFRIELLSFYDFLRGVKLNE